MRRGRVFFYLALILILGLVAVVVVWQKWLQPEPTSSTSDQAPTPQVQTSNVVVITQPVGRGRVLDEDVLKVVPWPQEAVLETMFTEINEVVGRQVKFDLDPGIALTDGMLVASESQLSNAGSDAALQIPRGMVAVSIPINRLSSVSYAPQAGDHINVIATMLFVDLDEEFQSALPNSSGVVISPGPDPNPPLTVGINTALKGLNRSGKDGGGALDIQGIIGRPEIDPILGQTIYVVPSEPQRPRMASVTLLQDVVVLQMGNFPPPGQEMIDTQPTEEATQDKNQQAEAPPSPDVVTLIVTPQDAVTLNYLIYSGAMLTLALRPAGDDTRFQTEAVTLQFLLDQYRVPVPVKLPYGMQPPVDRLVSPTLENDTLQR